MRQTLAAIQQSQATMVQNQAAMVQTHATMVQNQAAFIGQMTELKADADRRFNRIESILLDHSRILQEHSRILHALPDAVREKYWVQRFAVVGRGKDDA